MKSYFDDILIYFLMVIDSTPCSLQLHSIKTLTAEESGILNTKHSIKIEENLSRNEN